MCQKRNLLKGQSNVKGQVSEAVVHRLKLGFLKNFVNSTGKHVLQSLFDKAADLLQLYYKETSTLVFSCEICKISKNTFFREEFQWLLLRFKSCFQRSLVQKPVRLSAINTRFSWKKYLLPRKSRSSHCRCSAKEGLQGSPQVFSCECWKILNLFWKTSVNGLCPCCWRREHTH